MKQLIWIYLKGVAMGAADVIPGVSGGTIAFITGIYERLIQAIKNINGKNLKLLFTGKIKDFWKNVDGTFLLCLIVGIVTSFWALAHVITQLLDDYPILVMSFFFGLILASTFLVGKAVEWTWKTVLSFILSMIIAFCITSPENTPAVFIDSYWYIFLCGAIAICAMILPGISGSFILLLLGQYYFMMEALKNLDILVLLIFIAGALIGIVSFSNILSWLFKHFKMITLSALAGFMFGSLNKIWPWKQTLSTHIVHNIEKPLTEKNISPARFEEIYIGDTNYLLYAVLLIVFGVALIFIIEFISGKIKKNVVGEVSSIEDDEEINDNL
jgi:putative membrane protein